MGYLPELNEIVTSRQMTEAFYGYDHQERTAKGSWWDEMNLTTDLFPVLSQRKPRGVVTTLTSPQGLLAKDALAWVDGASLYYNGYAVAGITLSTAAEDCPKQLVSMGAYIIVFPDGVYVNTKDLTEHGSINAAFSTATDADVTYTPCRADGSDLEGTRTVSPTEPEDPENGDYWVDTSGSIHVLKQYSATSSMWIQVPTPYLRIGYTGIGTAFADYDGVTISGAAYSGESEAMEAQFAEINGDHLIYARSENAIVIAAILDEAYTQQAGSVGIRREAPKMDFVVEAQNRLWGCFYGMHQGKMLNEIYACALGDFKNWRKYMGISTDSYTVSLGTDGEWTGAITYQNSPLFFKEDSMTKIFGSQPSSYQTNTSQLRGVQKGSGRSLQIVNETVIYKGTTDICAFDGSMPVSISQRLGKGRYSAAVAGSVGGKYYVSMLDGHGERQTFVFDLSREIWHRETAINALCFAEMDDELYAIDADTGSLVAMLGSEGTAEAAPAWYAETGVLGYEMPDHKYVSRFNIRMNLGAGAACKLYMQYDSSGTWEERASMTGQGNLRTFTLPVIPRRCDHLKIRFEGTGPAKIFSIARILEQGGDG